MPPKVSHILLGFIVPLSLTTYSFHQIAGIIVIIVGVLVALEYI